MTKTVLALLYGALTSWLITAASTFLHNDPIVTIFAIFAGLFGCIWIAAETFINIMENE